MIEVKFKNKVQDVVKSLLKSGKLGKESTVLMNKKQFEKMPDELLYILISTPGLNIHVSDKTMRYISKRCKAAGIDLTEKIKTPNSN